MSIEIGGIYTGKVTGITNFGAFVELEPKVVGMVHISEVADTYVKEISQFLTNGQEVRVKVLSMADNGKLSLSIKKAAPAQPQVQPQAQSSQPAGFSSRKEREDLDPFEAMMLKYKQVSEERISDLKRGTEAKRGGGSRRK